MSMLGGSASVLVCLVSLALLISCVRATQFVFVSHLVYGASAGIVGGYWVPEALRTLGASTMEALAGLAIAVAWSALPGFAVLGAVGATVQSLRPGKELTVYCATLAAVEFAVLTLPATVPWILLGYSAVDTSGLAQLAAAGGVPLVSAALFLVAWACAEWVPGVRTSCCKRVPVAILVGLVTTLLVGPFFARHVTPAEVAPGEVVRFVAIQPSIPRAERLRPSLQPLNVDRLIRYSKHALEKAGPSSGEMFVIWPENAVSDSIDEIPQAHNLAEAAAESLNAALLIGTTNLTGPAGTLSLRNSVISLSEDGDLTARIDKYRAVPAVESRGSGLVEDLARTLIGEAGLNSHVTTTNTLFPMGQSGAATIALCFEILFPRIVSGRRPDASTIILNLADDSWIKNPIASRQLTAIARFRAIEQRLPLIRIAHDGLSSHYDAYGQLVAHLPLSQYASFSEEVAPTYAPGILPRMMILALPLVAGLGVWWAYPLVATLINRRLNGNGPGESRRTLHIPNGG